MPPVLIAFVQAVLLFVVVWTTRTIPGKGRKWGLRIAAFLVLFILSGVLAADPAAATVAGEYFVYFGFAAVIVYMIAERVVAPRKR